MWAKAKRSLTLLKAANKSVVNTETDNNNKVANNNDTDGNRQHLSSSSTSSPILMAVTVDTNDGHNVSIDSAYDSAADLWSPTLLTLRRPKPLATTATAAAVPSTPPSASNGHHNDHHYHRPQQQHQPYEQIILKKVNGREMILNTDQSVGFLSHPVGYYVRDLGNRSAAVPPSPPLPQPRPTTTTVNTNADRKFNNNNNTIGDYGGGGGGGGHRFVRNSVNRRSFDLPSPGGGGVGGDYRRPQQHQHRNHNQLTTKSSAAAPATSTTNSTTIIKDSVVDGRPKRFQSMSALPMITISADMSSPSTSSSVETKRKVILVSPPKPKLSAKMKSSISSMEEITREWPLMDIDNDSDDDNESVYFDSEQSLPSSLPPPLSAPISYPTMAANTTAKRVTITTTAAKRCLISTRSSIKRVVVNTVDDTDSDD